MIKSIYTNRCLAAPKRSPGRILSLQSIHSFTFKAGDMLYTQIVADVTKSTQVIMMRSTKNGTKILITISKLWYLGLVDYIYYLGHWNPLSIWLSILALDSSNWERINRIFCTKWSVTRLSACFTDWRTYLRLGFSMSKPNQFSNSVTIPNFGLLGGWSWLRVWVS